MCPGIAVLGGGGGSGDGDGDGAGSGNRAGAEGGAKGDGAGGSGGGKNGEGCGAGGAGGAGGCPNPKHGKGGGGTSAGDPVDVVTGRVYPAAIVDLALPGLIPLVITRSYSSASIDIDGGLGPGWSHSLAWSIEERRSSLRIHRPDAVDIDGLAKVVTTITREDGSTVTGSSGGRDAEDLHPAVQAALPPTAARGPNDPVGPSNCAEPQALSNHLNDWEKRSAPKSCAPGDPDWKHNLKSAMGEIKKDGGIASKQGDTARAACPNCSQTIPRLYALAGTPPPGGVCAPGERIDGGVGAASPPPAGYNTTANAAASLIVDPTNRGAGGIPRRGDHPLERGPTTRRMASGIGRARLESNG